MAKLKQVVYGSSFQLYLYMDKYKNGNARVWLIDVETNEPFAEISKYCPDVLCENMVCLDTECCDWAEDFIQKYKLGYSRGY